MRVAAKTAYTSLRIILVYECNANVVYFDGVQLFNTYGPWGEAWGMSGTLASTLGAINPLRYRGYVYDTETGLYYLNTRYYSPVWGRFINADVIMGANSDAGTYNLFAYCGNNPVIRCDKGGMLWNSLALIIRILPFELHAWNTIAVWVGIDTAAIGGKALNMTKKGDKFEVRGGFITQPLATRSKDDRPNLVYPVYHNGVEIYPDKQWIWEKSRLYQAIENDEVVFSENSGKWSVRFKQYLKDENGVMRLGKPISILTGPYNQDGTKEIETIFGKKVFNNPKPKELIKYLLSFVFDGKDDKDGIYLDSFGGSGTTAHAVLDLNRDGGNRKFILVEMGDYADSITAERVKRVIRGYGEGKNAVEGTGGNFSFYDLGEPLLVGDCLNEAVAPKKIREYIWFMETKQPYAPPSGGNPYYLGQHNNTGYYFYYEPQRVTVLDYTFLATITEKTSGTIIYADRSSITEDKLAQMGIVFKKIPRDISRL